LAKAGLIIDVQKITFHPTGTEHVGHHRRAEVMSAVIDLAAEVGVVAACSALRMPRSAPYREPTSRRYRPLPAPMVALRRRQPLALSEHEQRVVLDSTARVSSTALWQ
jgi:hypothetical protein